MALASIERVIKVGGNRWDAYIRLSIGDKSYMVYIPLLPKKPESASAELREDRRVTIRLASSDGGICSCELDLASLSTAKCYNISCTPGATWAAEQEVLRSHIKAEEAENPAP